MAVVLLVCIAFCTFLVYHVPWDGTLEKLLLVKINSDFVKKINSDFVKCL